MKEPAKPQNTIQAEKNKPFFSARADREGPLSNSAEPFFRLPALQTAMTKGKSDDKYEEQAERVAERVVNYGHAHSGPADSHATEGHQTNPDVGLKEENGQLRMQEEEEEVQMQEEEDELQMQEEEEELQMQEEKEVQMQVEEEEPQMQEEELQMQEEEEEPIQMKPGHDSPQVGEVLSRSIRNATGKGQPLPKDTREKMSHSFGVDFSHVKIHNNGDSAQMNRQLGAQAFTHGSDIFFNAGKFNPETTAGKKLLAHELTHVVQQQKNHAAPRLQGFFKKIKKGLKKVGKVVGGGIKKVGGAIAGGAKKLAGGIRKGIGTIGQGARRLWGAVKRGAGAVGRGVRKVIGAVGKGAAKVGRWIGSAAGKTWRGLKRIVGKVGSGLKRVGKWVWNGVKWVGGKLWEKMKGIAHRAKRWITSLPTRLKRLVGHLWKGVKSLKPWSLEWWKSLGKAETWKNFGLWLGELVIYGLEVMGAGEILETLADFIKFNTRPMTSAEIAEARKVFGDKIDYSKVRIDEYSLIAWIGKKKEKAESMAVTTFHTINFSRKIEPEPGTSDMAWLIHELVHVRQYEKMGAMYMARAVHAQNNAGYNYEGIDKLQENESKGLSAFNLEQQGDIIADYYRLLTGLEPKWEKSENPDISVYESYVKEI